MILGTDFRLGNCVVRPRRRVVERDGVSVHLKPKSMSVLEHLAASGGAPVSRNELFDSVWPGGEVSDDTLTKCIAELRKALGDSARESQIIETIPKLGFRLVPPVEPLADDRPSTETAEPPRGKWGGVRSARMLLVVAVLVIATLFTFPGARLWLSETGINWLLRTATVLSPHQLEPNPGIAVLPFVNLSGDPDNEYFSDGMSTEILNTLGRITSLPVIARSSSFQFKHQSGDIREIGRQLGVTHILEGSVRKINNSIRMTVHLIDVDSGAMVWSGAYQRELTDVFALQTEIAEEVVRNIEVILGSAKAPAPAGLPPVDYMSLRNTTNLQAYDLYLKGLQMYTSDRPALIEQSVGYFDRAIALDNDYADAWAAKGFALGVQGWAGSGSSRIPASVYPDAIAAFERALAIEPGHAFATGWLGVTLMENDFKWEEGMRLLEASVARNPNDAVLVSIYGFYMDLMHMEGAEELLNRAYRLDPFNVETIMNLAVRLSHEGRLLDAAVMMETALIQDAQGYAANYYSALFNIGLGRLDAAQKHIGKARLVANEVDLNLDVLEWLLASLRGEAPLPCETIWRRMQTEHLSIALHPNECSSEKNVVEVFDLAIRDRYPELRSALFGPKPPLMPESEWQRIRQITGVAQFQSTR